MFKSEDMKAYRPKFSPPAEAELSAAAPKRPKYGNRRTVVDGITFDSQREADRYGDLKALKIAGEVRWFARQVSFDLPGGVKYRADFVVAWRDGSVSVEDAKGMSTREYINKRKQMKAVWGIEIREI